MSTANERSKQENTYMMGSESGAEMARLLRLDLMVTRAMGGLLAEQSNTARFHRVLDVACGPGGWTLELAYAHQDIEVIGVDYSHMMIEYAWAQAGVQGLQNVHFSEMNVLEGLDFPDNTFDLVNARFMAGFLKREKWPELVQELFRVATPGGIIRLTEGDDSGITNSPGYEKIKKLTFEAMYRGGISFFSQEMSLGVTPRLGQFLYGAGSPKVHHRSYVLDFSAGEEAHESFYENVRAGMRIAQPFLIKMGVANQEELDALYNQTMAEMLAEDFRGLWYFVTAWGEKPL